MKKLLLTIAIVAGAMSANAQNLAGTSLNDRIGQGQDSIDVLGSLSLYQEAFKRKSYIEAIEPWEFVFQKAPHAMVRVYTDGAWMLNSSFRMRLMPPRRRNTSTN